MPSTSLRTVHALKIAGWIGTWLVLLSVTFLGGYVIWDDRPDSATPQGEGGVPASFNFGFNGTLKVGTRLTFGAGTPAIRVIPQGAGDAIVSAGFVIRTSDFAGPVPKRGGALVSSGLIIRIPKTATQLDGSPFIIASDSPVGSQVLFLLDPSISGYQTLKATFRIPEGNISRKLGRGIYRFTLISAFPTANDSLYMPLQTLRGKSNLWQRDGRTTPSFAVVPSSDDVVVTDYDPVSNLPPGNVGTTLHYWPLPEADVPSSYSFTATDLSIRRWTDIAKQAFWAALGVEIAIPIGVGVWRSRRSAVPGTVTIGDVAAEVQAPTDLIWTRPRIGDSFSATLLPSGEVELPDGRIFRSPSSAARAAASGRSSDGWNAWRLVSDQRTLAEVRREIVARREGA